MKHFELKNTLAGAGGGGSDPKPPTLNPPEIGDFSVAASYSYSEIIDLISDGPIEGLTNSNGYILNENSYLQGLYLNDIPVEVTNGSFLGSSSELIYEITGSGDCFTGAIQNAYQKIKDNDGKLYDFLSYEEEGGASAKLQTALPKGSRTLISIIHDESPTKVSSAESLHDSACIDISDYDGNDGLSGVVVDYKNGIEPTGSLDDGRSRYLQQFDTDLTAQDLKDFGIAAGGTAFFSKQCTGVGGVDTYYTETCLQVSNWEKSIDSSYVTGVYRNKIDEGLQQIIDIDAGVLATGYTKMYLQNRLLDLGVSLTTTDGQYNPITKEDISSLVKRKVTQKIRISTDFEDWVFPYSFVSYNTGQVLDGYNQSVHEKIFNNDGALTPLYDTGVLYQAGDEFFYQPNSVTYRVLDGSSWGPNEALTPPAHIAAIDAGVLIIPALEVVLTKQTNRVNTDLFFDLNSCNPRPEGHDINLIDLIIPNLDNSGNWNGQVYGFNMKMLDAEAVVSFGKFAQDPDQQQAEFRIQNREDVSDGEFAVQYLNFLMSKEEIEHNLCAKGLGLFSIDTDLANEERKFNYSNVLMEFRKGDPIQNPLGYFKDIFIDKFYNSKLLGPFNTFGLVGLPDSDYEKFGVQRLYDENDPKKASVVKLDVDGVPRLNFAANRIPFMDDRFLLAEEESSADERKSGAEERQAYGNWNKSKVDYDEEAQPVTHIIQNPNVESCFVTLSLKLLADTAEDELKKVDDLDLKKIPIGTRIPAPLNIRIEVGLIDEKGKKIPSYDRFFQIIALIESPNYMDIGNPDLIDSIQDYSDIRELDKDGDVFDEADESGGIFEPFELPSISRSDISSTDTSSKEDLKIKRYISITKLSVETNSTLLKRNVDLVKVTEIIKSQCFYPYSSIIGSKIDSRVFSDIPKRTFRAKLKKIKIPSNYFPIYKSGKDKRYFETEQELEDQPKKDRYIYKGDWDGTFKFGWSDNPAWVLYDMLTAPRYGLGEQISESQVNKWDLYKIARFCDSVNEDGYFEGVPDGRGGIEPRFSCNIMFSEGTKIFDAINSIAAIFRGIVFFQNSTIDFLDDRIKEPVALFTNSNVKDGFFSYSNYKRDERFNAVEVNYKDRNDDFKTKVEYVENEEDIIERGLFKKEIIAAGITSKAMARRAAKHVMYQTTKENETVTFTAGTEVLLCKAGDLVLIEDDLKTLRSNFGRVLEVDSTNKTIRTSDVFNTSEYEKTITLYIPTGNQQKSDVDEIASINRVRVTGFNIVGDTTVAAFDDNFAGSYKFDQYIKGYESGFSSGLYQEYAVYTGDNASEPIIWFNTGHTGWVFSTGQAFLDDEDYNLYTTRGSGFSFINITNPTTDLQVSGASGVLYDTGVANRRGAEQFTLSGQFVYNDASVDLDYFGGVVENQISINSEPQIRVFDVTGWAGLEGDQAKEYGDLVYIDQNGTNSNLLKFVPEGTVYRFQAKEATDQVYKIISIKEEEAHSYNVTATKYDSGKYEEIENDINIEEGDFTYGYQEPDFFVNDINYITLSTPNPALVTGKDPSEVGTAKEYYISGDWDDVQYATGYSVYIEEPTSRVYGPFNVQENNFSYLTPYFIGNYKMRVQALSDRFNNIDFNKRYSDSLFGFDDIDVDEVYQATDIEGALIGNLTLE